MKKRVRGCRKCSCVGELKNESVVVLLSEILTYYIKCLCVCVCVCVSERDREEGDRKKCVCERMREEMKKDVTNGFRCVLKWL